MRLTGERPVQGYTPDSLLALHSAGYRAVTERLGSGRVLDVGCGLGFESARLAGPDRQVVGVDYDADTAAEAARAHPELETLCCDGARLALRTAAFDAVCSSHIIEHFARPAEHVAELARVVAPGGAAFVLTPNKPADFENPYHISLLEPPELDALLRRHFRDVWVGGLDAAPHVKEDFAVRRRTGQRILRFDVLDLRHRVPRSWYIAAYRVALRLTYRLLADRYSGGATGISEGDWFVVEPDRVDETTLVLFAIGRDPIR